MSVATGAILAIHVPRGRMLYDNLKEVLLFLSVVDVGGFAAGSRARGLSRSAAGKAIRRLEDELGVRLLNRTTRAISLTDEGHVFYDHAQRIVSVVKDAETSVASGRGVVRGRLRLTVPDAFGRLLVLPLIGKFLATSPQLRIEVSFTDRPA